MHQPIRTAGPAFSSLGWALALSVCVHGVLLGAWLYARYLAQQGTIGIAQKRGGLTVQLTPMHAQARTPPTASATPHSVPARPNALPSQPHPPAPKAEAPALPQPAPEAAEAPASSPMPEPTPEAAPQAVAQPAQPVSAEQPGARFANLFAPIISRPLGRGRWAAQAMPMPPQAQAAMQREQAIQGTRQAVQARTDQLRTDLQTQPLLGVCDIRLALERQAAHIRCDQDQDQGRVAASLSGTLKLLPDMPPTPSDNCLRIEGHDTRWVECR